MTGLTEEEGQQLLLFWMEKGDAGAVVLPDKGDAVAKAAMLAKLVVVSEEVESLHRKAVELTDREGKAKLREARKELRTACTAWTSKLSEPAFCPVGSSEAEVMMRSSAMRQVAEEQQDLQEQFEATWEDALAVEKEVRMLEAGAARAANALGLARRYVAAAAWCRRRN